MMEDLNIIVAESAGEGIQTIGEVLAETIARDDGVEASSALGGSGRGALR